MTILTEKQKEVLIGFQINYSNEGEGSHYWKTFAQGYVRGLLDAEVFKNEEEYRSVSMWIMSWTNCGLFVEKSEKEGEDKCSQI